MKALVGAFNQEKALVGAFSVIVQPVVQPMDHFTALYSTVPHTARLHALDTIQCFYNIGHFFNVNFSVIIYTFYDEVTQLFLKRNINSYYPSHKA